jgi:hypothetical protein
MTRERNLRNVLSAFTLIVALLTSSVAVASAQTTPPTQTDPNNLAVTGSGVNALGQVVNFVGNLDITRFGKQGDVLVAVGRLTGNLTNTVTGVVTAIAPQTITLPVQVPSTACEILDLEIGAIDLNLLGLVVHLDPINLEITAVPGAGNLLGNLLCAIANLLNDGNPLSDIAGLLNRILRILG